MYRVTSLNPFSWAKTFALAWLIVCFVIGLLAMVPAIFFMTFAGLASEEARPLLLGIPALLVTGLLALLVVAVFVFLIALIQAAAFNWALGRTGGLEVNLALGPGYAVPPAAATPEPAIGAEPAAAALTAEAVTSEPTAPETAATAAAEDLPPAPEPPEAHDELPPGGA